MEFFQWSPAILFSELREMKVITLIPKIFYEDVRVGLKLFVDALGFSVGYSEPDSPHPFYILKRDTATVQILQDAEYAVKDRPEIRLVTDEIEKLYAEVTSRQPALLHPNLSRIKDQPWGLREFALLDTSGVCLIVQQQ